MAVKTGIMYMTRSVSETIANSEKFAIEVFECMRRYSNNDWGELCAEDKQLNDEALIYNDRILAKYETSEGDIYIITEWDRSATTILFTDEY